VNPLVLTKQGQLIALDAKVNFDDNALFRHPDLEELRDLEEEEPAEIEAKRFDLSYVKLTGNIGCMVNGAGLAMSTMDIIRFYGGMPANFLDVGGGATQEKVTAAFKIITADPAVKGHLRQHLWRHHEVRHHRQWRRRCSQGSRSQSATGGTSGRHQCRAWEKDPKRVWAKRCGRGGHGRWRTEDRRSVPQRRESVGRKPWRF
jgi:hypothetical protein